MSLRYPPNITMTLKPTLDRRHSPVCIRTLCSQKTDPFQQRVHIYLGRTYQQIYQWICSVATMSCYTGQPSRSLSDGRMLTRSLQPVYSCIPRKPLGNLSSVHVINSFIVSMTLCPKGKILNYLAFQGSLWARSSEYELNFHLSLD